MSWTRQLIEVTQGDPHRLMDVLLHREGAGDGQSEDEEEEAAATGARRLGGGGGSAARAGAPTGEQLREEVRIIDRR